MVDKIKSNQGNESYKESTNTEPENKIKRGIESLQLAIRDIKRS